MFLQSRSSIPEKLEEDFGKPVESIMRCEDFKSNFARRLSNRYIRSPASSPKQEVPTKLHPQVDLSNHLPDNVPERIELASQLSKNINLEQNGEAVKPPDKLPLNNSDIRKTEVTVLSMEVETLRWQLAQTEANRQMHIALLKQIVSFLNRVKEHIECQSNESDMKKDFPTRLLPRSFNVADLPRSRSVAHVNKNAEYFLNTPKKISTRKMSKSISNVNGFKDCNIWSQSKLSLTSETETSQKISEEMSRLITLANTVLSTKIPDLACSCGDKKYDTNSIKLAKDNGNKTDQDFTEGRHEPTTLEQIDEDAVNFFASKLNISASSTYPHIETIVTTPQHDVNFNINGSPLSSGSENSISGIKYSGKREKLSKERSDFVNGSNRKSLAEKRNDYTCSSFVEDESGFSSMSSFQEIGIPIISIIPPSPSKEIGFLEEIPDLIDDAEKWKTDATDLEKQTVKVFWV